MVERNEPSMTGCLPCMAVSHLVTLYRPTVRSLAVVPGKFIQGHRRNDLQISLRQSHTSAF